jgi:hypothetical protein
MDLTKLDSTSFANLCDDLVKACFPNAKCFEGRGGDLGIDCYLGDLEGVDLQVFQHKFLPKTLASTGKGEIRKSLETAKENFKNLKKWTLLLPKKFTFEEDKWFKSLGKKYDIEIEVWDETELKHLLYQFPSIRKEYLPLSIEDEKDLYLHFSHIIEKVINPLIEILKSNPEKLPNLNIILTQKENHYSVDQNSINLPYDIQLDHYTIIIPSINRGLCKDFLTNHYPDIINEWLDVHSTYDKYQVEIENINQLIH